MNVTLRKPMSVAEFLACEARQGLRFEFDGFAPVALTGGTPIIANDPVVVFEVVSEDTARTDRIVKLREYQATPSIQRYVIRDNLHMPEIDIEIAIDEFCTGLDSSSHAESEAPAADTIGP
jgi:Putative restriction endonuclease